MQNHYIELRMDIWYDTIAKLKMKKYKFKNQIIELAIRCIRLTHDWKFIPCGDWYGNIRIYDISNDSLK